MVCCPDEEAASPVDGTAADAGPKKTSAAILSRYEIVSDAESENDCDAGLPSVKFTRTRFDGEDGVAVETGVRSGVFVDGETVYDESARPTLSPGTASSSAARSWRLDRDSDGRASDSQETEDKPSLERRRRSSVRTASSPSAQVSPKRRKCDWDEIVADSDASDKTDDRASRVKLSLWPCERNAV